jgi:DNA-binding response OmpR family regulator
LQFERLVSENVGCDLVIFEAKDDGFKSVAQAESLLSEDGSATMLIIVPVDKLAAFRLPLQVKSDFVVAGASEAECSARIRQLLWPGNESSSADFVVIDNMTINLATYQVKVNGAPLDLTYLEYALLSFLVTHPGRTYSRDALLRRVWGFDYYGGSRTVDVHVRRVRAKLGPELAQRLETIRGVGYLWNS